MRDLRLLAIIIGGIWLSSGCGGKSVMVGQSNEAKATHTEPTSAEASESGVTSNEEQAPPELPAVDLGSEDLPAVEPVVISGAYLSCRWIARALAGEGGKMRCAVRSAGGEELGELAGYYSRWTIIDGMEGPAMVDVRKDSGPLAQELSVPNAVLVTKSYIKVEIFDLKDKLLATYVLPLGEVAAAEGEPVEQTPLPVAVEEEPIRTYGADEELDIKAFCSNGSSMIRWQVINDNPHAVLVEWQASGGQGFVTAKPGSENFFDTKLSLISSVLTSVFNWKQEAKIRWLEDGSDDDYDDETASARGDELTRCP